MGEDDENVDLLEQTEEEEDLESNTIGNKNTKAKHALSMDNNQRQKRP